MIPLCRFVTPILLTVCLLVVSIAAPSRAAAATSFDIGPSKGEVTAIIIGILAVGAAIGVGIYFAVRHSPSLTGCAVAAPGGLQLQNESDRQTYALIGDIAAIHPGDRVRVSGKRKKKDPAVPDRQFLVEHFAKKLGPCRVPATTP